jgi:hypothetical protein
MPLSRVRPALLAAALWAALWPGAVSAESESAGGAHIYSNAGGMTVVTSELRWKADMDPRTQAGLDFSVDAVSAASFDYGKRSRSHRMDPARVVGSCTTCHAATDALSGASQNYKEERRGFGVGVKRRVGEDRDFQVSAAYHANRENDYASDAFQAGLAWDFNDANSTLGLQASFLKDSIFPVTRAFRGDLDTLGGDLTFTQVLTPLTVAEFGYGFARAAGYQANPYAYIQIGDDDDPVRAQSPDLKLRHTASARVKQGLLPGLSAELGYRYYRDDWGVQGHSADVNLAQAMGGFVLEPHIRLYNQPQGADFFSNFYSAPQTYMTRDLKLAPHRTALAGVTLRGKATEHMGVELNYSRYTRFDDLDYTRYFADGPENADLVQLMVTVE